MDRMPSSPKLSDPDPQATAEALLAAGTRVFAERGFEAASVRAITGQAGATLGAITYHFGSKVGLYDRVIERAVGSLAAAVLAEAGADGRPLDRLERVVRAYLDHLLEHPELPRLILHQLLRSGEPPRAATGVIRRMQEMLVGIILEGQAEGSIRPGPAPLMAISVVSHPLHLALVRGAYTMMQSMDFQDPSVREAALENAGRFVRSGLAAAGGGP
jgi:AcrR family transcriptional regulator